MSTTSDQKCVSCPTIISGASYWIGNHGPMCPSCKDLRWNDPLMLRRLGEPDPMTLSLRAEIERLMDILIACCNAAGGQAVKGVSVDFLAHVPAEITGRIERLTRERDEAQYLAEIRAKINSSQIAEAHAVAAEGFRNYERVAAERDQLREQLEAARKDSEIIDWLERKGLSTIHTGVTPEMGVHCWEDRDNNCRKWTARYISSEFTSLRAAARAAIDKEASRG